MFTDLKQKRLFSNVKTFFKNHNTSYLAEMDYVVRLVAWIPKVSESEGADTSIIITAALLRILESLSQ